MPTAARLAWGASRHGDACCVGHHTAHRLLWLVELCGREPAEVPEGAVAAVALQRLAIVLHRGVPVAVARAPARPKRARASWS